MIFNRIIFSLSDHVEAVFKLTGKITVDQMGEMGFKELGYSKGRIGRNQGFSVSSRIPPILNRADNRGIGTGPSHASFFEFPHQCGFRDRKSTRLNSSHVAISY